MPYIGGRRDKASLKYEKEVYTPDGAKTLSDKELRKEYSRLRSIARKRLERFEGTEWTDTQVYQLNTDHGKPIYKPLNEITSNRELRYLFADVAMFVDAKTGSVKGLESQRKEGVQTLNERGYDFVTKQNYRKFADFMEYSRISNLNKLYDSKRVAQFFDWTEKKKMSSEKAFRAFRLWTTTQKNQKKVQNIDMRDSPQYRKQIDTGLESQESDKFFEDGRRLIKKFQNKKGKNK